MKFYRLSGATFYDHIDTIYQFNKPFLDKKKSLFLRNMEPLIKQQRFSSSSMNGEVDLNFYCSHIYSSEWIYLQIWPPFFKGTQLLQARTCFHSI